MASMLCLGPGTVCVAVALVMALSPYRSAMARIGAVRRIIAQIRKLVYNETISPEKTALAGFGPLVSRSPASRIHVAAVDGDGLPGDEITVGRGQENQRAQQVLGLLVALERARLHRTLAGGIHVAGILDHHRVAQGEARRQRIDANAVLTEFARERPRHRHDAALGGDVVQHPGNAAIGRTGTDIDDLAVAAR